MCQTKLNFLNILKCQQTRDSYLSTYSCFFHLNNNSCILFHGIWFGLFDIISTPYGLFNTEIWFVCKCLIIITLYFQCSIPSYFLNCTFLYIYYNIYLHTILWYQVLLSNTNNSCTIIRFQVTISLVKSIPI